MKTFFGFLVAVLALVNVFAFEDDTSNNLRRTQVVPAEGCPKGFGFNYQSTEPYCKINFKCAAGKKEFSTPCGCGCQPQKCGGTNGECPSGLVCNKGACF
jgi:hypothetical protein